MKKDEMMKQFNYLYRDETIENMMYMESKETLIIKCKSGYVYQVEYNNGRIKTSCLNCR